MFTSRDICNILILEHGAQIELYHNRENIYQVLWEKDMQNL